MKAMHPQSDAAELAFYYQKIASKSPDLLAYYSTDFKILAANDAFAHSHKLTPESIKGRSIDSVYSGELLQKIRENFRKCLAGDHVTYESFYDYPATGARHIRVSYEPDYVPGLNQVAGVIVSVVDITEMKETQIQLLEYKQNLEQKNTELEHINAQLDAFSHTVSHDLKSPARTVRSLLQLMFRKYASAVENRENFETDIDRLIKTLDRMNGLVDALLAYSRSDKHLEKESVDMNLIIDNVCQDLQHKFDESNATINIDRLPVITSSPMAMTVLFQNLIANSLNYADEDRTPCIKIGYELVDGVNRFFVEDNGIGIREEFKDRVFTAFQRAHEDSSYKGFGIGLASCKKLITAYGGQIWLESTVGVGTTVYFTLE